MNNFKLISKFRPLGDQPAAIKKLTDNLRVGFPFQTLLGVTGSGKTFTAASVTQNMQKPALVISHNKTLAAQLYQEFKEFFPENAVHYFVSYYDYYQPEAYIPQTDTYIDKDAKINELIDRLRHAATQDLLTRPDVIVVASVSCIYGIGSPREYEGATIDLSQGQKVSRKDVLKRLAALQYSRNDIGYRAGTYTVKGEVVEVRPMIGGEIVVLEWLGNSLEHISRMPQKSAFEVRKLEAQKTIRIFPAKHFITPRDTLLLATENIRKELKERLAELKRAGKLLEAERLEQRTRYDLEMMKETGYCNGIENYSRHLDFRKPGEPPSTLVDYFRYAYEKDWTLFIDESHMSVPQIRGMYNGDRARKETLVEFGFRLPSALDNRPLKFEEFLGKIPQTIFVSATPGPFEFEKSGKTQGVVEQLIRPTGLVDPSVDVRSTKGQIPNLVGEVKKRIKTGERALVTTLTKRLAEELADYLKEEKGLKVRYLHSEVKTLERPEILKDLRSGKYDVLVGINLLREGLDLPEVSLVAILDADKEGFLRNETTLVQTMGRAARHVHGHVILYADKVTESMRRAIKETGRRRKIQEAYNKEHGITPQTIQKAIKEWEFATYKETVDPLKEFMRGLLEKEGFRDVREIIQALEKEMRLAARELDFERAATIRDQIAELKKRR